MKIYIQNYSIQNSNIKNYSIQNINLSKLESYFLKKKHETQVYSEHGIYVIEENKIYKLIPIDVQVKEIIYQDMKVFIDTSFFKKEQVHNIPVDIFEKKNIFKTYKVSKLKFVVELDESDEKEKITDFYIETENENINQDFLYSEIHLFFAAMK
jgi:hypothetical protein